MLSCPSSRGHLPPPASPDDFGRQGGGTRGKPAPRAVHHGRAVRPDPRRTLGPAVPGKVPRGAPGAAPSSKLSAGRPGGLWRRGADPGELAARGAVPRAGCGRAGSPRQAPHTLGSPAGLELRGVRAEAAGVRQQEGAAGEPQLLPRGRGAAAVRLQDLLPRVPQALPGQRVPRAALHLRQRRHPGAGHRLLQPPGRRGRGPRLQQPHPLPLWLHLAGERRTCGRGAGGKGREAPAWRGRRAGGAGGPGPVGATLCGALGRSLHARVTYSRWQRRGGGARGDSQGRVRRRGRGPGTFPCPVCAQSRGAERTPSRGRVPVPQLLDRSVVSRPRSLAAPSASPWLLPQKTAHKALQPRLLRGLLFFFQTRYPVLTD